MQHGAHTLQARVLRLLPRDSERRCACAARDTRHWFGIGGHSWHVAPRARVEGERPLKQEVSFQRAQPDYGQRSMPRAHSKLERCVFPTEAASASTRRTRATSGAGLSLEAAAGVSNHIRATKKRGLSPKERSSNGRGHTTTSAARRAHASSSSAAPPSQRQRVPARVRCARHEALAWRWRAQVTRRLTCAR